MQIREYRPLKDAGDVFSLWNNALGHSFPVTDRIFRHYLANPPGFVAGDGWVAADGNRIVGFALLECERGNEVESASIKAVLVDPDCRRQEIGSRLLKRSEQYARRLGCRSLRPGAGRDRLWSGVPAEREDAVAFFRANGYELDSVVWDLVVDLQDYADQARYQDRLVAAGVRVESATRDDIPRALEFERGHFGWGWVDSMLRMFAAGDTQNVLLVKHDDWIIGSIQTYTPDSHWRGANVVWEGVHGPRLGGYDAVGIADSWRGRGLGAAMCEAAAIHLERHGCNTCIIDWTGLLDFYAKVGAKPWKKFLQGEKQL